MTRTVFGIHYGNSSACLAMSKCDDNLDRRIEVIANSAGERVMPSVVTVTENEEVVGSACKSLLVSRWNTTILYNKLLIDKENLNDIVPNGRKAVAVMRDDEICYELPLETGTVYRSTLDIAYSVLKNLHQVASEALSCKRFYRLACVLMVPNEFSGIAVALLTTAADLVGWDVLQVMNEPTAAVLGYNLLDSHDELPPPYRNIIVYRVGGKTCEVSLMSMDQGMLSIIDSEYTESINGSLLVSSLTNFLADQFYRKYKLDPRESHRSLVKLTLAAEDCMKVLSTVESSNCFIESLCEGVDFSYTMTRARFESLLNAYLEKFARPLNSILSRSEARLPYDHPFTLVLCGGPLKIPKLRKYISEVIDPSMIKEIVALPKGTNYDEVLACGAAYQAGLRNDLYVDMEALPRIIAIPTLGYPLTAQIEGADFETMTFPIGHPLPIHRHFVVTNGSAQITMRFTQPTHLHGYEFIGELRLERVEYPMDLQLEVEVDNIYEIGVQVTYPEAEFDNTHSFYPVKLRMRYPDGSFPFDP